MIARVATFDALPDDLDAVAVERLRETVRETPGYVAGFHLVDPQTNKAMSIVVVENESVLGELGRRLGSRADGERVGIDPDGVELYAAERF